VPSAKKANGTVQEGRNEIKTTNNGTEQLDDAGAVTEEPVTTTSTSYNEELEVVTPPTVADTSSPTITPSTDQGIGRLWIHLKNYFFVTDSILSSSG